MASSLDLRRLLSLVLRRNFSSHISLFPQRGGPRCRRAHLASGAAPFFGHLGALVASFDGAPDPATGAFLAGQLLSRTLPYGGGYCVGDVRGERGDRPAASLAVETGYLAGHAVRNDWKASGGLSARLQGAEPRSPRCLCTCGAEPGIPQVLLGASSVPMADVHRRLFFPRAGATPWRERLQLPHHRERGR